MPDEEFVVTPYEVRGRIDYARLRELFGTQELTPELLARIHHVTGGELHPLLSRGIYYSHRDLAGILDGFANGRPFFLYSGRGPSGPLHTSHLVPFDLCQWFQRKLGVRMYIQITDDEKFWARGGLSREETAYWGSRTSTTSSPSASIRSGRTSSSTPDRSRRSIRSRSAWPARSRTRP